MLALINTMLEISVRVGTDLLKTESFDAAESLRHASSCSNGREQEGLDFQPKFL
jgi:hypothetical protein